MLLTQPKTTHHADELLQREAVLAEKRRLRSNAQELAQEAKLHPQNSPEKNRLYRTIQESHSAQEKLETVLRENFLPQHSPGQLVSPRAFFVSPLFRVCSKRLSRRKNITLEMKNARGDTVFQYSGPELRQSDGLAFMGLLNLARDIRAGESVHFSAEDMCRAIFGRYDGPTRQLLKDHIKRLQRGLVEFDTTSVQLCLRFDFPKKGPWSVALDKDIVQLFQRSSEVWLELQRRQALPEGLATWLYSFVESQSKLIPTGVATLHELCGSDSAPESFVRMLRVSLKELTAQEIIDEGWRITKGVLYWRKTIPGVDRPIALPLDTPTYSQPEASLPSP